MSQEEFVLKWFASNPDKNISHVESNPRIERAWMDFTGSRMEDPDRAIRRLAAQGDLVKVSKGVYRFDSKLAENPTTEDFTDFTRQAVLERDGFECLACGANADNFLDLHVVHKVPIVSGGASVLSNGLTLCSFHKVARELVDPSGKLSRQAVRNLLDCIKPGGRIELVDAVVVAEELLRILEENTVGGKISWKSLA